MSVTNRLIKNILDHFDNTEQAEIKISYCSVDDEYTATLLLTDVSPMSQSSSNVGEAISLLLESVVSVYGENINQLIENIFKTAYEKNGSMRGVFTGSMAEKVESLKKEKANA